jgi:hypothetical protein
MLASDQPKPTKVFSPWARPRGWACSPSIQTGESVPRGRPRRRRTPVQRPRPDACWRQRDFRRARLTVYGVLAAASAMNHERRKQDPALWVLGHTVNGGRSAMGL